MLVRMMIVVAMPMAVVMVVRVARWVIEVDARTVPMIVLPLRVAAKPRQYLASGPEPVFTPMVPL